MSGWNGQFNARLQRLEKKAAKGGGGSSGGLVEIKNVEPFQVPDLVNGGTRLFDPANDSVYVKADEESPYVEISNKIISNDTPPGFVTFIDSGIQINNVITRWNEVQAYEDADATEIPHFCVAPSTAYSYGGDVSGVIIKPASIVYKYTARK